MKTNILCCLLCLCTFHSFAQDSIPATSMREYPVLWQQTSSEYRALCYQAFNIATRIVNEVPKKTMKKGNLAIITDLDETIFNNSNYDAQLIKESKEYTATSWKHWLNKSAITAIPGAVDFLQYAKQKGISIFYISNRDTSDVQQTIMDLKRLQFPDADIAHCIFMSNTSCKEARRKTVMNNYNVLLLMGDNLNDFMDVFEKKSIEQRFSETDKVKQEWGNKFIVLPNATYGEWENAMYNYQKKLTNEEKELLRKQLLKGY